jgi:hypothetical protein
MGGGQTETEQQSVKNERLFCNYYSMHGHPDHRRKYYVTQQRYGQGKMQQNLLVTEFQATLKIFRFKHVHV